jgi:MoxR-like ATPase
MILSIAGVFLGARLYMAELSWFAGRRVFILGYPVTLRSQLARLLAPVFALLGLSSCFRR